MKRFLFAILFCLLSFSVSASFVKYDNTLYLLDIFDWHATNNEVYEKCIKYELDCYDNKDSNSLTFYPKIKTLFKAFEVDSITYTFNENGILKSQEFHFKEINDITFTEARILDLALDDKVTLTDHTSDGSSFSYHAKTNNCNIRYKVTGYDAYHKTLTIIYTKL